MYKGRLALALAGICVLTLVTESHATTVAEMSRQKSQTESNLQSVNSEISQIEARQEQLKIEVGAMDTQLVEVLASISICKDEIIAKEEEVSRAKVDLEKAQKKEQEQYDAMKQRIRFMYEKGDNAYLQLFFEAKSLADMINKADYVEKLYTYDRDLLQTYTNVKNETKEKQQLLEEEEAELLAANYELEQEQASLEQMINEKKATIENFDAQLVRARVEAQKYKRELTKQTQQLRTLEEKERQKAAEKESEKKPAKSEDAQQGDNGETSNGNGTSQNGPAQGEGAQNGEVQPDGEN
ncbi:MAG: hypothetical protein J6P60_02805, partial [Lachnospiraceae bacterium]|nr:hypothetical protein [Lachnospiraceae bacterium]